MKYVMISRDDGIRLIMNTLILQWISANVYIEHEHCVCILPLTTKTKRRIFSSP